MQNAVEGEELLAALIATPGTWSLECKLQLRAEKWWQHRLLQSVPCASGANCSVKESMCWQHGLCHTQLETQMCNIWSDSLVCSTFPGHCTMLPSMMQGFSYSSKQPVVYFACEGRFHRFVQGHNPAEPCWVDPPVHRSPPFLQVYIR